MHLQKLQLWKVSRIVSEMSLCSCSVLTMSLCVPTSYMADFHVPDIDRTHAKLEMMAFDTERMLKVRSFGLFRRVSM